MKVAKSIISLCLIVLLLPVVEIILMSFQQTNGQLFKWYQMVLADPAFTRPFMESLVIAILTALVATALAFILALSWFSAVQRYVLLVGLLLIGLLPPDILAISINKLSALLGFYQSSSIFLIFGLVLYCLPFGIMLLWSRFYFISPAMLIAAKDMGMHNYTVVRKLIYPLSAQTVMGCFLFSFLLAFSEFPRSYYLGGSVDLISRYLNGQLRSGAGRSIYAGSSLTVLLSVLVMVLTALVFEFRKKLKKE